MSVDAKLTDDILVKLIGLCCSVAVDNVKINGKDILQKHQRKLVLGNQENLKIIA